jgi:hypothetical protein
MENSSAARVNRDVIDRSVLGKEHQVTDLE